jgi:site-specific DNA-cytosine methylase
MTGWHSRPLSLADVAPTITSDLRVPSWRLYGVYDGLMPRGGPARVCSVAEVRRLCSFPDDYVLEGRRAEQIAQLVNAVPPLLMRAVARAMAQTLGARALPDAA